MSASIDSWSSARMSATRSEPVAERRFSMCSTVGSSPPSGSSTQSACTAYSAA